MMDSQEKTLIPENTEELNVAQTDGCGKENIPTQAGETEIAEQAEATDENKTDAPEPKKTYKNKQEVIDRIKEIADSEDNPQKDEIDFLKTVFYKMHFTQRETENLLPRLLFFWLFLLLQRLP